MKHNYLAIAIFVVIILLSSNSATYVQTVPQNISDYDIPNDKISMTIKDMDIREVLKNIGEEIGKRFEISPDVMGKISVSLKDVTPQEALNEVLKIGNLQAQHRSNTIAIVPNRKSKPSVFTEKVFQLKTAKTEDIREVVESMLSESGNAFINQAARVVLVQDYWANVDNIGAILEQFDPTPAQIAVDAAILSVSTGDEVTIGVKWSSLDSILHKGKSLIWQGSTEGMVMPISPESVGLYTAVTYANISNFIEALRKLSNVKILSRPKILVIEGQEAEIIVGKKLGYRTTLTTVSQTTMENIQFLEVGTQLKVTPRKINSSTIMLTIHPEVSDGEITATGLPMETTSEVTTSVIVKNGQTVIIGGLINDKKGKTEHAVPILGSIPLLGRLFKRTEDVITKSEMVVLITPRFVGTEPDRIMARDLEKSTKILRDLQKH